LLLGPHAAVQHARPLLQLYVRAPLQLYVRVPLQLYVRVPLQLYVRANTTQRVVLPTRLVSRGSGERGP
jgi:hypothetical protein